MVDFASKVEWIVPLWFLTFQNHCFIPVTNTMSFGLIDAVEKFVTSAKRSSSSSSKSRLGHFDQRRQSLLSKSGK